MNKKHDLLCIILAITTGVSLLAAMLIRAFLPAVILPKADIITLLSLTLITLLLDYYIFGGSRRVYWQIPLYSFLIFGLFPWAACFLEIHHALITGALGAVIFTATTYIFDSMLCRLADGTKKRLAPAISAFGIYLAAQCFLGIF